MDEMISRLMLVAQAVFAAATAAGGQLDDDFWRLLVSSQIEAMRDPTASMITAAAGANSVEEIWRLMIAAILG